MEKKRTPPIIRVLAVIGMVLLLTTSGCDQDNPPPGFPPGSPPTGNQTAMALFLKSYTPRQDAFRDSVVSRLLALDQVTPIINRLTSQYGQPHWELERTSSQKAGDLLLVPMQREGTDSVALMVFLGYPQGITLRVFPPACPDTLVADLMLYYRMTLHPEGDYSTRRAEPKASPTKDVIVGWECMSFFYSLDHGVTWVYSYSTCKPVYYDVFYNPTEGGGGEGEGVELIVGGGATSTSTLRALTTAETQQLTAVKDALDDYCPSRNVLNSIWGGQKFYINPDFMNPAGWDPNTNAIFIRSAGDINAYSLLEELFHAYQNAVYPGGIAQYKGKPGETNIEFEAKLFKDLYFISLMYSTNSGWGSSVSVGSPESEKERYSTWISNIYEYGFTPTLLSQYNVMLGYFNSYSPYGGKLLSSLNLPTAISKSKLGCN